MYYLQDKRNQQENFESPFYIFTNSVLLACKHKENYKKKKTRERKNEDNNEMLIHCFTSMHT